MNISVVIPLFNEEESIKELSTWIVEVMKKINFLMKSFLLMMVVMIILERNRKIKFKNSNIKGVKFLGRNYGKSAALNIGFLKAKGDVVITMDADLQDSPDEIPKLYEKVYKKGFDLVSGWKKERYDPISKTVPTKLFNWAARKASGIYLHDFNCGLKAYNKNVIKNIEVYTMQVYSYDMCASQIFNITEVLAALKKNIFIKLVLNAKWFLDLLTISFISRFGNQCIFLVFWEP